MNEKTFYTVLSQGRAEMATPAGQRDGALTVAGRVCRAHGLNSYIVFGSWDHGRGNQRGPLVLTDAPNTARDRALYNDAIERERQAGAHEIEWTTVVVETRIAEQKYSKPPYTLYWVECRGEFGEWFRATGHERRESAEHEAAKLMGKTQRQAHGGGR